MRTDQEIKEHNAIARTRSNKDMVLRNLTSVTCSCGERWHAPLDLLFCWTFDGCSSCQPELWDKYSEEFLEMVSE